MHFFFRTDGNEVIATGHVMRCLSIADACVEMGHDVTFITADNKCESVIRQRGFKHIETHGEWNDLEGELEELNKLICKYDIRILIIDSYYVTEKYLRELSKLTETVYIDDLNTFNYPVDILINYTIYADKFMYQNRLSNTKLLLGCSFVPLRSQFRNIGAKEIRREIRSILITTGGTDNRNLIGTLLNRMLSIQVFKYVDIHIVVGIFNINLQSIYEMERINGNVKIHSNVTDMAKLMIEADVAVAAGGSTLYELCACGVPTITYSFADNQIENVHGFAEKKLMEYAGDVREGIDNCVERIVNALKRLMQNPEKRTEDSYNMQRLVDGIGGRRIIDAITIK